MSAAALVGIVTGGWPLPAAAAALEAKSAQKFVRPAYQVLRQNEDWSVLKSRPDDAAVDPFDGMKYVVLGDSSKVWASFGVQLRLRAEFWNDFNFGAAPAGVETDDLFGLSRLMLHADLHFGRPWRVFVQAKSSLVTDRELAGGRRNIDRDEVDLQNAFLELAAPIGKVGKLWIRAGRQELLYGKQRLVSPLDWVNTRRTFEGLVAQVKAGSATLAGFWTQPVIVAANDFNEADETTDFYGLYAVFKRPGASSGLDLYWLSLDRERATFAGVTGAEERQTLGARFEAAGRHADLEFEGAYQFGEFGSSDIEAYMVTLIVGFADRGHARAPRLYFGLDYASGDEQAGDGKLETFNQLFPLGHAFLGYMDFVGRQNIVDLSTGLQLKLTAKSNLQIDWHHLRLATANEGLYGVGGAQARQANPGGSKAVGDELDLLLRRPINPHLALELGLGRFLAASYLEETGAGDDVDFAYLSGQYTF